MKTILSAMLLSASVVASAVPALAAATPPTPPVSASRSNGATAGGYGYGPGPWMMGGGWRGPQMMGWGSPGGYGGGYGPWMMGGGWRGPQMMGWGGYGGYDPCGGQAGPAQQANLDLSVAQVKSNLERLLALGGNPHIKLGAVTQKNADTITADIVTTDKGGLVQRFEINRKTGFVQPAGE